VGVLAVKGQSPTGQDQDDVVLMPFPVVQRQLKGITWLDDILCAAVSPEAIAPAKAQITALLRERHRVRPGHEDDFNLRHPAEIAEARAAAQRTMTLLLANVAAVALLVGGIGIMNIMLVSGRTREIGLRRAVGARATSSPSFWWKRSPSPCSAVGVGSGSGCSAHTASRRSPGGAP
jgi:putative ABC transport system permease protein